MKRIIYIPFILILFVSCKKILDTKPGDFISPEYYYNTEAQLNTALNSVYDILGKGTFYGDALWEKFDVVSDEGFFNANSSTGQIGLRINSLDASNADVYNLWALLYEGINRANLLLQNIKKPAMDETKRTAIEGQARFLRAYYYFMLVSNWNDVPLVTEPTASVNATDVPRTPAAQVYAFILSEMQAAEQKVPTITSLGYGGRVSKTAVEGILARVCLTMAGQPLNDESKYAEALSWANKVMTSGEHALNPDYRQIFINYAQDLYDIKESMWEVEFWGNQVGNNFQEAGNLGYQNGITTTNQTIGYSFGFINASPTLYNKYAALDTSRRDWNCAPFGYSGTGTKTIKAATDLYSRNCGKWRREYETLLPKALNHTSQNFPILRYADVLLMFAEAENHINGPTTAAYNALNLVRARAYNKLKPGAINLTEGNAPAGMLQGTFQTYLQDERLRELAFECERKPDLIRWGIYVSTMKNEANYITLNATATYKYAANPGNNTTQKNVLLPIPQTDLTVNKLLTQNPGW